MNEKSNAPGWGEIAVSLLTGFAQGVEKAEAEHRRSMRRFARIVAMLLLAACAALAGAIVHDSAMKAKTPNGGARTWYLNDLTGNHSTSSATAVDRQYVLGGDTWLKVFVRGSGAPGTTCQIAVLTAGTDGVLDVAEVQTATLAAMNPGGNGYQPNAPLAFDVAGAESYDVRCVNVSTGTIDVSAHTVGAFSAAAE